MVNFNRLMADVNHLEILFFECSFLMSFAGVFGAYVMVSAGYGALTGHDIFSDRVVDFVDCAELVCLLGMILFFCAVGVLFVLLVAAKKIKSLVAKVAEQPDV